MLMLSSADFFEINFFKKIFDEHYQNVKQANCKGYQQTKVAASKERVLLPNIGQDSSKECTVDQS